MNGYHYYLDMMDNIQNPAYRPSDIFNKTVMPVSKWTLAIIQAQTIFGELNHKPRLPFYSQKLRARNVVERQSARP